MKGKRLPMAAPAAFYDPERDGVTQGLLYTFRACRELVRDVLAGWSGKYPGYPLVYGSLAHYVLHRAYRDVLDRGRREVPTGIHVGRWLQDARDIWVRENPIRSEVTTNIFEDALMKNGAILPYYFKYWKSDFLTRQWLSLEREFRIPWTVTARDGRTFRTFIRGKIDGAFLTPKARSKPKAPRIQETKTRTQIDENQLIDVLPMNLQTSVYILATQELTGQMPVEVEYNIIRKTSLRQGKKESWPAYEARIVADVRSRMDWYFVRMSMVITSEDIARMRREIDELISDFLLWWYGYVGHYRNDDSCYRYHRPCDMIKKCSIGDTSQLFKRKTVFSELEEE